MQAILSVITSTVTERQRVDDDAIDRLHHHVTTMTLVIFAVVVSLHQYVGNPITCWVPADFTGSHTKYTNSFCWVKNTYFLPFENEIPHEYEEHLRREIIYYQWTPFIFLGMAIGFYFPNAFWRAFNSKAGVDSDNILETADNFGRAEKQTEKERYLRLITNQLDRFLGNPRMVAGSTVVKNCLEKFACLCGKRFGNYLIILYFIMKLLYIGNVFAQLFILNSVLQSDSPIFGLEMITNALTETPWLNSTIFPKVTMCDIMVRKLGNVQRYTVQCVLPINLYTEKMMVFLWFWLLLLLLLTFVGLAVWVLRTMLKSDRYNFIEARLVAFDRIDREKKEDRKLCLYFVHSYLRQDGAFILRLILHNTNGITAAEIVASVWDSWLANKCPSALGGPDKTYPPGEDDFALIDDVNSNKPRKPKVPPKPSVARPPPMADHHPEKPSIFPSAPDDPPAY